MKKFILMAAAVLMTATAASAQLRMGVKAGVNVANMSNTKIGTATTKSRVGFTAGVFGEYALCDRFALSADVLYSPQGFIHKLKEGKGKSVNKYDYLNVPILANYYIVDGLAVKAGLQPGILLSAKTKISGRDTGNGTFDIKETAEKFDLSLPVGVSYELPVGVQLDLRYAIGMTSVNKIKLNKNQKNGVFSLTAGYKF